MTEKSNATPDAGPPLSEWETLAALRTPLGAELFSLNKAVLLDALASSGVTHVAVTFEGYGDSGQIENVEVRASGGQVLLLATGETIVWIYTDGRLAEVLAEGDLDA